jgi:hypothetical protein
MSSWTVTYSCFASATPRGSVSIKPDIMQKTDVELLSLTTIPLITTMIKHTRREILNKLHTRKKQKGLEDKTQVECTDFFVAIGRHERKSTKSYTNKES